MDAIIVTGTPGSGKTTFAKKYAKEHKLKYFDVNVIIDKEHLYIGFDKKRDSKIISIRKLVSSLKKHITESKTRLVIDSHLSHYLPKKFVSVCFVTKCDIKKLKQRLIDRGYPEEKIRENLDAEILDVCRIEALERRHSVETVMTS